MSKDASYASAAEIQAWYDSQPPGWESSVYLSSDESDEICVNPESEIRDKGADPDGLAEPQICKICGYPLDSNNDCSSLSEDPWDSLTPAELEAEVKSFCEVIIALTS